MKKILIIVAVALPAFFLGFIGIYYAMPMLAPERVEETRHMLDSLRTQASMAGLEDSTLVAMQYHAFGIITDSLGASLQRLDSSMRESILQQEKTIAFLRDSLKMAHERLTSTEQETSELRRVVDELNERLKVIEAQRVEAKDLSATLPKLETGELSPILQQLDMNVLEILYSEASGRNRMKILQALSSDRAARFVKQLVSGKSGEAAPPPSPTAKELPPAPDAVSSPPLTTANGDL
ncbi:hypothetical protein [Rhodocaloribacter sp.]